MALEKAKLAARVGFELLRSGVIPLRPDHWLQMARAWRECGPSFAFLGRVAAARFPHEPALQDEWGVLSYDQLNRQAEELARFLKAEDKVEAGHKVAIIFSNHRGFVLSLLAVTRLGADVLPLNPRHHGPGLREILLREKVNLVLHEAEVELDPDLPGRLWQTGLNAASQLPRTDRPGQLVVLTSGSTGVAKGIRRRPGLMELLPVTAGLLRDLPLKMRRPTVLAIPFYHGYGIATLAMALALGSCLITNRRYRVGELLELYRGEEPPLLVTVPTLLWRWQRENETLPEVGAVITGSAPLKAGLCRELLDTLGPVLYNLYGATETGLIALATPEMLDLAPGCVGKPLPGNLVEVLGNASLGPLRVRGPLVLNPGLDGWRETGDLGRFDAHDYLHVLGRADSMIVSGGENVYPHELEEALSQHPQVIEVAVLAVDDEEFGERLVAAVVAPEVSETELLRWLAERLERFKIPRTIHSLERIPRNALGKVDRRTLRAML